ncbi:Tar ligand binding domain-containing protein, partial [Staphylococcus aureus]
AQLSEISERMNKNSLLLYEAATKNFDGSLGDLSNGIKNNSEAIDRIWSEYLATYLTTEEKATAQSFISARMSYLEHGIKPAFALMNEGKN